MLNTEMITIGLKRILFCSLLLCAVTISNAQETKERSPYKKLALGIGVGLPYGGIGANLSVAPIPHLAAELGVGYNLNSVGVNGGASVRILPYSRVCPDIGFLYGYNAAIIIKNKKEENETYYGASVMGGIKIWNRRHKSFVNIQIIFPFRPDEYSEHMERLKDQGYTFQTRDSDVLFAFGFHF